MIARMVSMAVLATATAGGLMTLTRGAPQSTELRILSYNIKHGQGMDDSVDLDRAAALIRRLRPDLVALQEIDSATTRTDRIDQASRLGALTGMHSVFGGFMPYREGAYGMAVLSRFPILEVRNHRLPNGEEPRTALAVRVKPDGDAELVFVGIHLYRTEEERVAQIDRLLQVLGAEAAPIVLAGDFNSQPASRVMRHVAERFALPTKRGNPMTFPSDSAAREIDFIAFHPEPVFEVLEYRVIDEPVTSDHRPVLMVVRMGGRAGGRQAGGRVEPTANTDSY